MPEKGEWKGKWEWKRNKERKDTMKGKIRQINQSREKRKIKKKAVERQKGNWKKGRKRLYIKGKVLMHFMDSSSNSQLAYFGVR